MRERLLLRPEVERFAGGMEERLRANEHKASWHNCLDSQLFARLAEECYELMDAVLHAEPLEVIEREAADVGNFAMFIADNCRRAGRIKEVEQYVDEHLP